MKAKRKPKWLRNIVMLSFFLFPYCSFSQKDSLLQSEIPTENRQDIILSSKEVGLRMENCKEVEIISLDDCTNHKATAILTKYLSYPAIARDMGLQGTVYIQFVVNENGLIDTWEIIKSSDELFTKEVKRAFAMAKREIRFFPPDFEGKKVKASFTLPVRFVLK